MMKIIKTLLERLKKPQTEIQAPAHSADRCICCGDVIPEGRTVCWKCEHEGE